MPMPDTDENIFMRTRKLALLSEVIIMCAIFLEFDWFKCIEKALLLDVYPSYAFCVHKSIVKM